MLTLLLVIPLIGCLLLLPIEENSIIAEKKIKKIALSTSVLNLIISILMWLEFDFSSNDYQFVYEFNQLSFYHFNIGVDGTSLYFVLLTTFITPLCLLSNWTDITKKIKYFVISFLILETLQIAVFVVLDLFLFYIFFESVLIPLFVVILTWGASESRIRAAFLFFLYTFFGSLFMLLAIITIYYNLGSTDFQLISLSEISIESQKWLWLSLSFSKRDMTSRIIHKNRNTLNLLERFPRSNPNYLPVNKSCKDLVLFGSNLSSTVNYPAYTLIVRHLVQISPHLDSLILGVLLSDGWLFINKSGNTLLAFKQSTDKLEFFFKVFNQLSHYCSRFPNITSTYVNNKTHYAISFSTRTLPCLTEWYNIFYINKKKVVPLDLYNLLTYEALAYWIMCDGTRNKKGLVLQTQSFTIKEVILIINVLMHKFNLKCSIQMQRNQPTIYIYTKSMKELSPKIIPYFVPSMLYKISGSAPLSSLT